MQPAGGPTTRGGRSKHSKVSAYTIPGLPETSPPAGSDVLGPGTGVVTRPRGPPAGPRERPAQPPLALAG